VIAVAVTLNLVVALFCFYVAWRLWRLSKSLGAAADALTNWERSTRIIINPVVIPPIIMRGQAGTARLRLRYSQLQTQLQRLEQVMAVASLLPMASRWLGVAGRRRLGPSRSKKR
jgi:heme/copper-type cytochrome/quinol oxidase subunit 2